jgi:hypothetical protein
MISLSTFGRFCGWAGVLALCLSSAATFTSSAAPARPESVTPRAGVMQNENRDSRKSQTDAEQRFDDAIYGVDPIVTGPVSTAFKERQKKARCAEAVWPNIPATCYPD